MKFKLLSLLLALGATLGLEAVILKNGAEVDEKIVNNVYPILRKLHQEDCNLLSTMMAICRSGQISPKLKFNKIVPGFYKYNNQAFSVLYDGMPIVGNNLEEKAKKAHNLKLANAEGKVSDDVCAIIMSATASMYQGIVPIVRPSIHSPISYKNYFSWSFWFPKK